MGMKRRPGNVIDLARQFQEAQAAYEAAVAEAERAASERQKIWSRLVAAGPEGGEVAFDLGLPGASRAPANGRRSTGRRRRSRDFYGELQTKLHASMKPGVKYTGPALQELVGASNVSDQTFTKRVRGPLVEQGRIKKSFAEKNNTSPVNVRWVKA